MWIFGTFLDCEQLGRGFKVCSNARRNHKSRDKHSRTHHRQYKDVGLLKGVDGGGLIVLSPARVMALVTKKKESVKLTDRDGVEVAQNMIADIVIVMMKYV